MWRCIHKLSSPKYFYHLTERCLPWFASAASLCFIYGLIGGLYLAPADYQQGDGFRIMYVHVPAAFMSLAVYLFMACCVVLHIVWKLKIADVLAKVSAPLGASFTFLALITGALWGKPMWGTYWIWDARLTSELILLFLYLAYMALFAAIDEQDAASRASGILLLVGVINIPIIHFSVIWWHTLHQGASLSLLSKPKIAAKMLYPLLAMLLAFGLFFIQIVILRARCEILSRESNKHWVRKLLGVE